MLVELSVRDLGVIESARLDIGPGLTVLTGETGAGKTMVVEALALLLGGKADNTRVRPGAVESVVEGRFVGASGEEVVLRRVVPASGRSRAYVDDRMATAAGLAEVGGRLAEICGQHAHQRLQSTRAQRSALDRFAGVDLAGYLVARSRREELEADLAGLGGDEAARLREMDLLAYQLDELDAARIVDPDEDDHLDVEEDRLADAVGHLGASASALESLSGDGGVVDVLAAVVATLRGRSPFDGVVGRLDGLLAEITDSEGELRSVADAIDPDPQRLDAVRNRRQLLVDLRRKYGSTLADVMEFHRSVAARLADLRAHESRAAAIEADIAKARDREREAAEEVLAARRRAAPVLSDAIEARLAEVALDRAGMEIAVDDPAPGDRVEFRMSTNPGMAPQPVAKAASGGELSRAMLCLHQVLSGGAPTMVFDEVDAGVGGTAATAVGRALARLARSRQVIAVTHLPQVAAYADVQLSVVKSGDRLAVSTIVQLDDDSRVVELSRMLSGSPDSDTARRHAEEILAGAASERAGTAYPGAGSADPADVADRAAPTRARGGSGR
ncbi:MAG: DNA repair protein RecN [Microthrixaceae bacterium]